MLQNTTAMDFEFSASLYNISCTVVSIRISVYQCELRRNLKTYKSLMDIKKK